MRVFVGPLTLPPDMAAASARGVTGRPERADLRVSLVAASVLSDLRPWRFFSRIRRSSGWRASMLREAIRMRRPSSFLDAMNWANLDVSAMAGGGTLPAVDPSRKARRSGD